MNKSIASKTYSSVLWNIIEKALTKGFSIIVTLVLAWFLSPEDYGIIAMISVFIALSNTLIDAGFSQTIIRTLDISETDLNTVFYSNIFLSLIVYTILFFLAPFIANFYNKDILILIIRVVGISIIFNSLYLVQQSLIQKEMKFKLQLKIQFPASVLSGIISVYLAYLNLGVWAIIFQIVMNSFFTSIFFFKINFWTPSIKFSLNSLKKLFKFSSFLLFDSLISIPFKNIYLIVLPKFFSASLVGFYLFSEKIKDLILMQTVSSIQTVTYSALSTMQEDNLRLKNNFKKVILVMTFILSPILIFLATLSEILFEVILPNKWNGSIVYLQLMCIVSLLYPVHSANLNLLKIKGYSNIIFYTNIFKNIISLIIFSFTIRIGIIEILVGQLISSLLSLIPNSYYSSKLIKYYLKEQILDFSPPIIISFLIAIIIYKLQEVFLWNPLVELLFFGNLSIILYIFASHLLNLKAYLILKEIIKNKIKNKL